MNGTNRNVDSKFLLYLYTHCRPICTVGHNTQRDRRQTDRAVGTRRLCHSNGGLKTDACNGAVYEKWLRVLRERRKREYKSDGKKISRKLEQWEFQRWTNDVEIRQLPNTIFIVFCCSFSNWKATASKTTTHVQTALFFCHASRGTSEQSSKCVSAADMATPLVEHCNTEPGGVPRSNDKGRLPPCLWIGKNNARWCTDVTSKLLLLRGRVFRPPMHRLPVPIALSLSLSRVSVCGVVYCGQKVKDRPIVCVEVAK